MNKNKNAIHFSLWTFVLLILTQFTVSNPIQAEPLNELETDVKIEYQDTYQKNPLEVDKIDQDVASTAHQSRIESDTYSHDTSGTESEIKASSESKKPKETVIDSMGREVKEETSDKDESEEGTGEGNLYKDINDQKAAVVEPVKNDREAENTPVSENESAESLVYAELGKSTNVVLEEVKPKEHEETDKIIETESYLEEISEQETQPVDQEPTQQFSEEQSLIGITAISGGRVSTPSTDYFKAMTDNLTVYDNRGEGPLKPIGKLKKGQVYPIVRDYGNWWRVQFGDIYGYVKKSDTVSGNKSEIKNLNRSYSNTEHKYKANQNVTVYDNTSGNLVDFGELSKETIFPIASDYGNWWRIIYLDRVGYVRKSEGELQYANFNNYFKTEKNLPIYTDNSGSLNKVGEVREGQTYHRVSDNGNWHRIQFGDTYGYVEKFATSTDNGNSIKNKNKSYENTARDLVTLENVTVYDNTSGSLVPFGQLDKGTSIPIATDYGNWWRIIFAERVGYVRKAEVQAEFEKGDSYFRVNKDNLPVYDNRNDGPLQKVGELKKDQVYSIVSDYGNWWRVQFGDFYGYVKKSDTGYATGNEIKNLNHHYSSSTEKYVTNQNVTIYDNTSGSLVPFGQLDTGIAFPIATDYGNWWRIIYLDRIGYVRKSEGRVLYTDFDKYFKADENLAIYDNRGEGPLKKVGELIKGQVYPRVSNYGNWHRIQFGNIYGYVRKEFTIPVVNSPIKNENKSYANQSRQFEALQNVIVYDNTSDNLVPFGQIDKGANMSIATDYGNWWRVLLADRVGYVRKSEARAEFLEGDQFFRVFTENTPIYDNRRGYLTKVGELDENQVFLISKSYGNWWGVQFGDIEGFIRKRDTGYATVNEINNVNYSYTNSEEKFIVKSNATVYDNTSENLIPMGELDKGAVFPIATDYGNWWRIIFLNRVGYVNKNHLLEYKEQNLEEIIRNYKEKDTSSIMSRIQRFSITPGSNYISSANNMLNGHYRISSYGTFDFSDGIIWGESPIAGEEFSRSYYRALHGHFFISDLIAAYHDSGNKAYIYKGIEIIEDWINQNPYGNSTHALAWHDEGTARRLVTWVHFYDAAKDILEPEKLSFLLDNMIEHADIITTDAFHSPNTNHGMFQDEALIVFSDYFDTLSKSQLYNKIGQERLKDYFDFIISDEGVHLEHSPGYHQIIANSVKKYRDYFDLKKDRDAFRYYEDIYKAMADYYIWLIKPDGGLPLIGDTFNDVEPTKGLWQDNPYYQYVLTGGKEGVKPPSHSVVFKDAGYAIFRDNWDKGKDATYLHFTAAYHTAYHKHSDDLSVWIYANGHDIVTESGPNGYDYHLPFTEYAYSSYAHNTLIVNDKGLPRVDGQYEKVYMKEYTLTDDVSNAVGVNERYKDVVHQREVIYDRTIDQITVSDTISSKKENNYKLLWNLAEGVTPEIQGNRIKLYIDGTEVMAIEVNSLDKVLIEAKKGQKDPYYLGWHLTDRNVPVETYTIIVEANEADTQIETIFKVK